MWKSIIFLTPFTKRTTANGAAWRVCRIVEHNETVGKYKYLGVKVIEAEDEMTMVHKGNLTFKTIRDAYKLYKVI